MDKLNHILDQLHALANAKNLPGMARFGIKTGGRLGISIPQLRKIANQTGRDHQLSLELWDTGIPEARILASMIDDPAQVTVAQSDSWLCDFNSWDICDQVCGNLFDKTPFAWEKISKWAVDEREYVRRAGYVMLACLAVHDKNAPDASFTATFPFITAGATDPQRLIAAVVDDAVDDKTARWIARDALRELTGEKVQERLRKKTK